MMWSLLLFGCLPPNSGTGIPTPATNVVLDPTPTPTPLVNTVDLRVVGYNVESGGAESSYVADTLLDVTGEAAWGFSEVATEGWLVQFAEAAADDESQSFTYIYGTTGGSDRLGLVYDENVLTYVSHEELFFGTGGRAPLVATFDIAGTPVRFKLMVNHLWRSNEDNRHDQAQFLNQWAAGQDLPLIAVGDYNFDWGVSDGDEDHDLGYDLMTAGGEWTWVRPEELIRTQCSRFYDSVLDFSFVGGAAHEWEAESDILFRGSGFCISDDVRPDHRPVDLRLTIPY